MVNEPLLTPFLQTLSWDSSFEVSPRDWHRLNVLLGIPGTARNMADLRRVLQSVLVHTAEQQRLFDIRFNEYFPTTTNESFADSRRALEQLQQLIVLPEPPIHTEQENRPRAASTTTSTKPKTPAVRAPNADIGRRVDQQPTQAQPQTDRRVSDEPIAQTPIPEPELPVTEPQPEKVTTSSRMKQNFSKPCPHQFSSSNLCRRLTTASLLSTPST